MMVSELETGTKIHSMTQHQKFCFVLIMLIHENVTRKFQHKTLVQNHGFRAAFG